MTEPAIARALGGKVWRSLLGCIATLLATACFGVLVDSGWTLPQAGLASACAAALLLAAGVLVQQRTQLQGETP
ncbi:MAG: hypothetical protein LC624_03325 [Halobacteriales archaeon]|nr:hypothetical protein [Halobacteriales archaeon]